MVRPLTPRYRFVNTQTMQLVSSLTRLAVFFNQSSSRNRKAVRFTSFQVCQYPGPQVKKLPGGIFQISNADNPYNGIRQYLTRSNPAFAF